MSAGKLTTLGRGCVCATLTKPSESWAGCVRSTCRATRPRPSLSSCNRLSRSYWAWRSRCEVGQPIQEGLIHIGNQPSLIIAGLKLPSHSPSGKSLLSFCSRLLCSIPFGFLFAICLYRFEKRRKKWRRKGEYLRKYIPAFLPNACSSSYFSFSSFPCFSSFLFPPVYY